MQQTIELARGPDAKREMLVTAWPPQPTEIKPSGWPRPVPRSSSCWRRRAPSWPRSGRPNDDQPEREIQRRGPQRSEDTRRSAGEARPLIK
jgi:hypothetical protein